VTTESFTSKTPSGSAELSVQAVVLGYTALHRNLRIITPKRWIAAANEATTIVAAAREAITPTKTA